MSYIPTPEQAYDLISRYNQEAFHLRHAQIVSGVLGFFAKEHDPENVAYWQAVGMLHDIDFEKWPDEHCVRSQQLLRELDVDECIIRSTASHGYGLCVDIAPESVMEKYLFATDELTGLIGAVAMMRPSKSVDDMELKSVMKKYKQPSFAAGCSRAVIQQGADMLGISLEMLIEQTILAMRSLNPELGL